MMVRPQEPTERIEDASPMSEGRAMPSFEVLHRDALMCQVRFSLSEASWAFEGHFPLQPVLPGVVQVLWVRKLLHYWFASLNTEGTPQPISIRSIPQMKFTKPLFPEDTVQLILTRSTPEDETLLFRYERVLPEGNECVSQGKVKL